MAEAQKAAADYTRSCLRYIHHIPTRYFLPPVRPEDTEKANADFRKLAEELGAKGYIELDCDGEPACLTGKPPYGTKQ